MKKFLAFAIAFGFFAPDVFACSAPLKPIELQAVKMAGTDVGQVTVNLCSDPLGEVAISCSFAREEKRLANVIFTYFFRNAEVVSAPIVGSVTGQFVVVGDGPQNCSMSKTALFDVDAVKGITLRVEATSLETDSQSIYPLGVSRDEVEQRLAPAASRIAQPR